MMNLEEYFEMREREEKYREDGRIKKRELTKREIFLMETFLMFREEWQDCSKVDMVLDKIAINVYLSLQKENVGRWLVGGTPYACAFCDLDGTQHKLQKVKYIGNVCKECALKYKTKITQFMRKINRIMSC